MENYTIGCDAHKKYSQFTVLDEKVPVPERKRIEHTPGAIREYLGRYPSGTPVAVECVGNWYRIVDEIETAGCVPRLTQAGKAKLMMVHVNKTDKLDADGLALTEVWGHRFILDAQLGDRFCFDQLQLLGKYYLMLPLISR